ncbi:methyltransferase domain-containing protein [Streptomyces sp. HPF1205]|uniref:methyltransferase domain-containing protein n=1 Tax=Streptomyces sp. HPF1205 TaxID=2873262 RepID=UPI001CEDF05C|nr:methyltransferase domain-containing protein [Streptomyces sp. HPF1205]
MTTHPAPADRTPAHSALTGRALTDSAVTDSPPAGSAPAASTAAPYVHGYSERESRRLADQADTLAALLHEGTAYPPGSRVLEAGCGVGAQTAHLVAASPGARVVAVDMDAESLARARTRLGGRGSAGGGGVEWYRADVRRLPFPDDHFDHVFVCFLLEHLAAPAGALAELRRVLRPGGTITVIEGDHGSAFFHPAGAYAEAVIGHQVRLQAAAGGNALMGRQVVPLLAAAGFTRLRAEPRTVCADRSRPALAEGFTRLTFTPMVAAVREEALAAGLSTAADFDRGIAELYRTAEEDGTFQYTFLKATAVKPGAGESGGPQR